MDAFPLSQFLVPFCPPRTIDFVREIWDYVGDKYVHRLNQSKIGSKSIATNHQCASLEGECGLKEDDEVGGALFSIKDDTVILVFTIFL